MDTLSRPLIAVLLGTVALAAVWFVALKPGSSSKSGSPSPQALNSDVAAAHKAVGVANSASAAAGGQAAQTQSAPAASPAQPAATNGSAAKAASTKTSTKTSAAAQSSGKPAVNASHAKPATKQRLVTVSGALEAHRVVALLFYNPAAADDRAVKKELASVPESGRHVVKLAVPLNELARYQVVTTQVPVSVSPTLVLIDRQQQASEIVGFADRFEIAHRVADALATR